MKKCIAILMFATSCLAWDFENSQEILACEADGIQLIFGTDAHKKGFVVTFDMGGYVDHSEDGVFAILDINAYRNGFHAEWPKTYPKGTATLVAEAYAIDIRTLYSAELHRDTGTYVGELASGPRTASGRILGPRRSVTCQLY